MPQLNKTLSKNGSFEIGLVTKVLRRVESTNLLKFVWGSCSDLVLMMGGTRYLNVCCLDVT